MSALHTFYKILHENSLILQSVYEANCPLPLTSATVEHGD